MDDPFDDFSELEAELKTLRPAAPSRALELRVARRLEPRPRWVSGLIWASLPAAAAVVFGISVRETQRSSAPAQVAVAFQPVAAENVLYSAKDEGYVTLEDGTPARRLRSSYVDTITWKNPQNHASLRWSVPREEI